MQVISLEFRGVFLFLPSTVISFTQVTRLTTSPSQLYSMGIENAKVEGVILLVQTTVAVGI